MIKRFFDLTAASAAAVVLAPVFGVCALLVRTRLGRPVLFRQDRPGRHAKTIRVLKFRSMTDERDDHGRLLPNEARSTPFGRVLRRTSLDELPQLLNVVRGDLSLVGPRPLRMEYLPLYSPEQLRRHEVRPGITGLAQVSGRNGLTWEEKFELDVWYVDNQSFLLDMKILFRTIRKVFTSEGVEGAESLTVAPFGGAVLNSPVETPSRR